MAKFYRALNIGILLSALALLTTVSLAETPPMFHYQGRVTVGGAAFTGNGYFKFFLESSEGPLWDNEHGNVDAQEPDGVQDGTAVVIPVSGGQFSVRIGDLATLGNMQPVTQDVFFNSTTGALRPDVKLRVWFSPDENTLLQELTPAVALASAPYALVADTVVAGAITTRKLADGAVTGVKIDEGTVTGSKLAPGAADAAISDESITSQKIKDGEVKTSDLAIGAVTSIKILDGTVLGADVAVGTLPPDRLIRDIAIYAQVEGAGVGGGLPSTAWQVRTLNRTETQTLPTGSGISRSLNTITLQPGRYLVSALGAAFRATTHQIALRDVTNSPINPPIVVRGTTEYGHYSNPPYSESSTQSTLSGVVNVAGGPKSYQLFHYFNGVSGAWGGSFTMGYPQGGGDAFANENVYVRVVVERIE